MMVTQAPERSEFQRVANAVSTRAAELLHTQISVTDAQGVVVASSDPSQIGRLVEPGTGENEEPKIRVPLRLATQAGEVLVEEPPASAETVPSHLARALVDLVVNQFTLADQLSRRPEVRNRFIYDLLHGTAGESRDVLLNAKLLDLDLAPPRAVILIDAADFIQGGSHHRSEWSLDEDRRRARLVVASVVGFFHLPDDTICAESNDGEIVVLKASDSKNLAGWIDPTDDPEPAGVSWSNLVALKRAGRALLARLRQDTGATINAGIGRYHPGIPGLARSYEDARAALSLGRRFHGQNRVHCLDELGLVAFVGLADERTKLDLATNLLSPLDHEPDLITTLQVFFAEDCCPSAAALRLAIHRNTLNYRLHKVATMTGLNPRRFDEAAQIRLALVLRSLSDTPD